MKILALVLGFLQIAPDIIEEILGVVNHATNAANVNAATAAVQKVTAKK